MKNVYGLALSGLLVLLLAACGTAGGGSGDGVKTSVYDVNMFSLDKLSCDPLGNSVQSTDTNFDAGIKADLYYLANGQSIYHDVESYISNGVHANQFLFFSQINVPTRMFDTGFPTMLDGLISKDDGTPLFEYFALRFSTTLQLAPTDPEGLYEFALLSDDGAILKIKSGDSGYQVAVDNDGDHPTQMGCSTFTLNLRHGDQKLMQLDYYQGPRYHISVIPLWRKVGSGGASPDPMCGHNGNNLYFDPNHNSVPLQAYNDLLARGWKPIQPANYTLPQGVLFNPCQGGVAPVVSNFVVTNNTHGSVTATWNTDILSTTQLRIVDMATGVEQLTFSDNVLYLNHTITANNLLVGHQYMFQAVSISESYGKTIGSPITIVLAQ